MYDRKGSIRYVSYRLNIFFYLLVNDSLPELPSFSSFVFLALNYTSIEGMYSIDASIKIPPMSLRDYQLYSVIIKFKAYCGNQDHKNHKIENFCNRF